MQSIIEEHVTMIHSCGRLLMQARHLLRGLAAVTAVLWYLGLPLVTFAVEDHLKPLWEAGIVAGGGWLPDYPASDENHFLGLALPRIIYRGRIFRAGDGGIVRGRLLRSERHEFDISLSGSFPVDSDKNNARIGMPNLDFLLEIGPRLNLTLAEVGLRGRFGVELPVRTVFSFDLDEVGYRGVVFHPKLVYRHRDLFATGIGLQLSGGPIFATEELMDYFYQVGERFVTPDRPAFNAEAGYLGSEFGMVASRKLTNRTHVGLTLRVGYYTGATNTDSPLFRSDVDVGLSLGFTWSIYQSKRRVID
ncbi:hypothetical protein NKDENANG_00898 [Candidatus Entotheonellaceae bacterium PAL068K]